MAQQQHTAPASGADERRIELRELESLQPHPRQALFPDLSEEELERLAEDMRRNGLLNPVEIISDGTIICGCQRVRAAKRLGWTKIPCWIRDDLAEAGELALQERLLADNMNRRQLSKLGMARCAKELMELHRESRGKHGIGGELRDYVAGQFNMSGRNLDRYLKVLDTPIEIQDAFDAGQLKLDEAAKVGNFPPEDQRDIADAIRDGQDPKPLINEHWEASRRGRPLWKRNKVSEKFVRRVEALRAEFEEQIDQITLSDGAAQGEGDPAEAVARCRDMLDRLIA